MAGRQDDRIGNGMRTMLKLLQRLLSAANWMLQTAWSILSGILGSLAALFGHRPARPVATPSAIGPEDVDAALRQARLDHEQTSICQPHLDAAMDLIWTYVTTPASDRPMIDLSALDEGQRNWLLSRADDELCRLAVAGRMATVEAILMIAPAASSSIPAPPMDIAAPTTVNRPPLSSLTEAARAQLASRTVGGRRQREQSTSTIAETHDPAWEDALAIETAFRP